MRSFWLFLSLAACGSGNEGKRERAAAKSKDLSPLFTGSTVTLPPEIANVRFGDTQEQIEKATGGHGGYVDSKTLDKVSYQLDLTHAEKKLEKINVSTGLPLQPLMTKQWGSPIVTGKGVPFWFDPKTGMRAWLSRTSAGTSASFSRYDSFESLLGPTGFALAFAQGKPLIGATLDELHAAWGSKLCDFDKTGPQIAKAVDEYRSDWNGLWHDKPHRLRLCLSLPRTVDEFTPFGDEVDIGRMGKVEDITLVFKLDGAKELAAQATAFFDAKFGTPTVLTDSTKAQERWYFDPATQLRAIARFTDDMILLEVGRYTPVATLLAADAQGVLSVATKSMPGGTPAAIQKEDPTHYNQHGTLPALVFPATDFARQELEVQLESWDKAPTTHAYRAVLFHTNNETAGDALLSLLEAKLGKAKKDPAAKPDDETFTWTAKGGAKVSARRVSQQWQIEVSKE